MISRPRAFPCAKWRGTSIEYWRRAVELGDVVPDPDRRRSQRRGAIVAQGRDPAAGASFRLQRHDAAIQRLEPQREPAVLGRHAVLWGERLRVAGGALQ